MSKRRREDEAGAGTAGRAGRLGKRPPVGSCRSARRQRPDWTVT